MKFYEPIGFSRPGIYFTKKQRHTIALYCIQNRKQKMNFCKLKWLFYFFAYRLNRWLGGITKWERRDPQATSKECWEYCMFLNSIRGLKRIIGGKFAMTVKEAVSAIDKASSMIREHRKCFEERG